MIAQQDDPRRADFLAHIVVPRRSTVVNDALYAARAGVATPEGIRAAMIVAWERRLAEAERRGDRSAAYDAADILGVLGGHRDEALAFCTWCIDWEQLSPTEKSRQKAARGEEFRQAYQEAEPPTQKQRAYLHHLGCTVEPRSKRHASELIDGLLKANVA